MDAAARRAIAEQLADAQRLDPAAVEERAGRARSAQYWATLCPELTIGSAVARLDEIALADSASSDAARQVREHGYGALPDFLPAPVLARLNRAIDVVTAAGWPANFAWVFDDLWAAARTLAVGGLLDGTLGSGARQVPHVWVHIVPAVDGARGWGPHKDGGLARGSRSHLSIWMALTDAAVDNGCIYVLPRSAASAGLIDRDWSTGEIAVADAVRLMSAVRALPVSAGAALAWDFDVLHWSGTRYGGGAARRSLSLEFIARETAPCRDEHPLLACGPDDPLPDFAQRLAFIADGIMQYGKHEAGVKRFRPLAERLLSQPV
jgi:hypothetical protein